MNQKKKKQKQKAKFELSAGGIVFCPETGKFLVIKDSKGRIALPKGLVESGESLSQAAKRETEEETGVKNLKLVKKIGEVSLFYRLKKDLIFKKIVYFLFEASPQQPTPQKAEIQNAFWVNKDEFTSKLSFDNLKPLAQKALSLIEKQYGKNN